MDRQHKVEAARRFSASLTEKYPQIVGIVLGGSIARGNDLPVSDIDLWCFVEEGQAPPSTENPSGVEAKFDVEQYPAEILVRSDLVEDSYFCGFISDAMILCDRDSMLAACQERVRASLALPENRRTQLASIRASIERNFVEFGAAIAADDSREACRASVFAAWSLCDHMLTDRGSSPGGPRGIARLATVWPDAYEDLVAFEAPTPPGTLDADVLTNTCLAVVEGKFFTGWIDKARWMFTHGHEADAYHALWLALALQIKGDQTPARLSTVRT